jgi:hypothetical protein
VTASSRSLPLVALVIVAVILVVQIRVIAGGQTWDDVHYHTDVAPPRLAAAEAVQRGDAPLWWDGSGLGVPLAAEPGHGALYPPIWLAATPRALDLLLVAHLAWAALGVAVWARRRASDRGALVAGLLAATTGILISAALRGALPALAHLPWLGAAAGALADADSSRGRARAACAIGALLGAIALTGELAVVIDAIAIALVLGKDSARGRSGARIAGWLGAAIAAGLAIGAVQWIPALIARHDLAGARVSGLPLGRLIELLVPYRPALTGADAELGQPAIAAAAPWASLFVGAPLLALAAIRAPSRRVLGVIGGLGVAALVVGRGGWPAWLGAPELHVAVLAIVLAVNAAPGLDALVLGQRRAVIALAIAAGFAALALAALAALRAQRAELAPAIDRALVDGTLGIACMAGAVLLAWRASGRRIAVLFALLVAPGAGAAHAIAPAIDRAIVDEPPAWAAAAQRMPRPVRAFVPVGVLDRPDTADAIAMFAGGSGWRWRIAAARSQDPARSPLHDQVWLAAASEGGALLDRYGIALAVLPSTLIAPRKLEALGRRGAWSLVELPVAPVASVMEGWQWAATPADALALLFPAGGGTGIGRGTLVLRGSGPPGRQAHEPRPCEIRAWQGGEIELSCTAETSAYAVVSSSVAPGWSVRVDGAPVYWQIADVLRRAVEIPPGTHHVRWSYAPPGLAVGAALALAGMLALVALRVAGRSRSRRDTR